MSVCAADDEDYGEEGFDQKGLTKKDIHTLNEQRRRDVIRVRVIMCIECARLF